MFNVFESPWLLLIFSFIFLAVVVIVRRGNEEKSPWWFLFLPFVFGVVSVGLDFFIHTDHEKITSVINIAIQGIIEQDVGQIGSLIASDYSDSAHNSKERLMAYCQAILSRPIVEKVKKQYCQTIISPPNAATELHTIVHFKQDSVYALAGNIMSVKMELHFAKKDDGSWLINNSEILSINRQSCNWKDTHKGVR